MLWNVDNAVSTTALPLFLALGQKKKKKLLYWRNPTDPKIRADPTFFFLKTKKKTKDKKMTDQS